MLATFILAASGGLISSSEVTSGFACSWIEPTDVDPSFEETEFAAKRVRSSQNERWELFWEDGRTALTQASESKTGTIGEYTTLEWTADGATEQAFVTYLPDDNSGEPWIFITFDLPSNAQTPGYICRPVPLEAPTQ